MHALRMPSNARRADAPRNRRPTRWSVAATAALGLLTWVLATPFAPCSTAAPAPAAPPDARDLAGALRSLGLAFEDAEQAQMQPGAVRLLETFASLRRFPLPDGLPDGLVFDPRPEGFVAPEAAPPWTWSPPSDVRRPATDEHLAFLSIAELAALLRSRQVTSEELTRLSLHRLRRYGPALRCLVTLTEERALEEARRADAEIQAGRWRGPLHGIPYGAKDLLATRGAPTTWGVALRSNVSAEPDAAVVRRLERAGAVLVAKLSLGELAMGDVWFGGKTRNPWHPDQGSSGSSAGSAAAVAAGLVPFALGSETLGSIVSPATICGVTGLRPTFGRVARTGAMTLCGSLDKLGPLARSAEDCALVLDAIRGTDPGDPSAVEVPFEVPINRPPGSWRIGFLEDDLDRDTANRAQHAAALDRLRELGMKLRPVRLPEMPGAPLRLILDAEASASFDELTRNDQDATLVQQAAHSWPNQFRIARLIPAVEYLRAQRLRRRLIDAMHLLFRDIDVLIAPPWQGQALLFGNMTGHPCVVVPTGDRLGASQASLCFLAGLYREGDAVAVAAAYQGATDFHRRRPDLVALEAPNTHPAAP
ncbi:MAG: amidase [Verrucomicrobiales bacterium]|nr:amidase [Verrucomicrobiales bacterium]